MKSRKVIVGLILISLALVACVPSDTLVPIDVEVPVATEKVETPKNLIDTSINIFKESVEEKENSLISPISVLMAMSMTTNGAEGVTLEEIEKSFGMNIGELNKYFKAYNKNLDDTLQVTNSIWIKDMKDLKVEEDFMEINRDNYNALITKLDFNEKAVTDINNWVSENTNEMIDGIIEEIDTDAIMYLINAIAFEGKWEQTYSKKKIYDGKFTSIDKKKQNVEMMSSEERMYLSDNRVTGFIKPYEGDRYSFVALLPNENIKIEDYIKEMTGDKLINLIENAKEVDVDVVIPKFSYDYSIEMNNTLKSLGIKTAFDENLADFSKMATAKDNIYIGLVLHKTFIEVDEIGTKAAAVTSVEMKTTSFVIEEENYSVILDRPFVYAILDNDTGIPIFIGTVMDLGVN